MHYDKEIDQETTKVVYVCDIRRWSNLAKEDLATRLLNSVLSVNPYDTKVHELFIGNTDVVYIYPNNTTFTCVSSDNMFSQWNSEVKLTPISDYDIIYDIVNGFIKPSELKEYTVDVLGEYREIGDKKSQDVLTPYDYEGMLPPKLNLEDSVLESIKEPSTLSNLIDSGKRRDFSTGSVRDDSTGKGRYDLIPYEPMRKLAVHYENGAIKYDPRNWEKGQPLSVYLNSATRHLTKLLAGHDDEDHASAVSWNMFGYVQTLQWIAEGQLPIELDDLPHYNQSIKE